MKKYFFLIIFILFMLQAQPAVTYAACTYLPDGSIGSCDESGVSNGTTKDLTTPTTNTVPTAPATTPATPAPVTATNCPNGGSMNANGVCNLGYTPLEPIPGVTDNNLTSPQGFASLVNAIFKIMITTGALLAVLMLTIGGVQYMTSSSIGNKTAGLDRAKAAVYGMLLLAGIYIILNTINPHLLNFDFIACSGGGCQSSINSFTQTSGFTTPTAAAPTTVTAPPAPAGAILASPNAIQFNDQDSNTAATRQAESDYTQQCQSSGGVPIFAAGSGANQTAMECIVSAGSHG
jgi:hypothetical protein